MRLSGKLAFERVYQSPVKQTRGPLKIFYAQNSLAHARMGLSVSRRVGTGPQRNRIKRLLRESFRLMPRDASVGYDLIVVVRPHEPLALIAYQKLLTELITKLRAQSAKREA